MHAPTRQSQPAMAPSLGKRLVDVLNYDYVPQVDAYLIDWMRQPTGILCITAIMAGLAGWVVHPQGYLVMAVLVAVLVLGLLWPWITMLGVTAHLEFDSRRGVEGEPVPVRLLVRNRMPWNAWGLGLQVSDSIDGVDASLRCASGWKTTILAWDFIPPQRGEYPSSTPMVFSGFPFGLWKAKRRVRVVQTLLVWPRTMPVGSIPEVTGSEHQEGLVFRNKPGQAGEILGVRPFRTGDSLRRIHWSQTARYDRLIVCERQTPGLPAIRLTLDTDPTIHTGIGSHSSREWCIRLGASLAIRWLKQGAQVEALLQGKLIGSAGGVAHQRHLLDTMARIRPTGDFPLSDALLLPACHQCRAGCNVIITTNHGIRQLSKQALRGQHPLLIVVDCAIFTPGSQAMDSSTLPFKPWIEITSFDQLRHGFRTSWKGECCGCG